jgi:hypothetical protein
MQPWSFQSISGKKESREHYKQFILFVRQGPTRSLPALLKQCSDNRSVIYDRAKRYDWIQRAKAFDKAYGISGRSSESEIARAILNLEPTLETLGIDLSAEPVESDASGPVRAVVAIPPGASGQASYTRSPASYEQQAPVSVAILSPEPTPQPQAQPVATPARSRDHWREIRRQQHMKAVAELRDRTIRQGREQQALSGLLIETVNSQIRQMQLQDQVIPPNVLQSFASTAASAAALAKAGYESQTKGLGIDHMLIILEDKMADDIAQMAAAEEAMGPVDA